MLVEELISVRWCDCMCFSAPTACLYCHLKLSHLLKGNKMKPKVTTALKTPMSQVNVDFFCFQCWSFFAMSAFSFHSSPFCLYFSVMRTDATVTVACPQSLCLGDVAVYTLWLLFQPSNPSAQRDSHCPRAQWTSGAVVGFGYFRLQPKSSMCFLVPETCPSSTRGKSRWGATLEVTLNLLCPCDFPDSTVSYCTILSPSQGWGWFPRVWISLISSSPHRRWVADAVCTASGLNSPGPPHPAAEFGCLGKASPLS